MKNKKIIISNGFNNFPMRFIAEGLNKKGYDVMSDLVHDVLKKESFSV